MTIDAINQLAISAAANGLSLNDYILYLIYDLTANPVVDDWKLTGNSGTNSATNFIGTTDNVDLIIKRNSIERLKFNSTDIEIPSGTFTFTGGTANRILALDNTKNLTWLDTATYPSLTELSYVKGVTSSIQAQLNGKQNTLTNPVTGTGTNNEIAAFNSTGSTITSLSTATYPSLTELSYVKGVTSSIQTQLNTISAAAYNTKLAAYQNTNQTVTGTVAETIVASLAMPLMGANDNVLIESLVTSIGSGGVKDFKMYISPTNNSIVGATQIATFQHATGTRLSVFVRHFTNKNNVALNEIRALSSFYNDYADNGTNVSPLTVNVDTSIQRYLVVTITLASAADTAVLRNIQLYWNRA